MVHGSMEVVHEGMLKKSPPPKSLWRAKWRMRWFVLRSGELPGQYFLEYYTDRTCRKLKGKIDLDQCDQVDAGITFPNRKQEEYKHMFDIKTPKRVYYLCADTEWEMTRWVDCVCQVCGLKMYPQEDEYPMQPSLEHLTGASNTLPPTPPTSLHTLPQDHHSQLDSPSLSPSSISGPYIPISECITGKRNGSNFPFTDDMPPLSSGLTESHRSSIPNEMAPPAPLLCPDKQPPPPPNVVPNANTGAIPRESYDMQRQLRPSGTTTSDDTLSVQSPLGTEGSSVFSEEEWAPTPLKVDAKFFTESGFRGGPHTHRETHLKDRQRDNQGGALGGTSPGGSGASSSLTNEMRVLTVCDDPQQEEVAPPRPPKPPHLTEVPQQTYQNLETIMKTSLARRNSSNDKVKNSTGGMIAIHEPTIGVSDPEPSPASVTSSVPPTTPSEVKGEVQALIVKPQQHTETVSPQAAERSKQRICYNNLTAAPMQNHFFSYDVRSHDTQEKQGESEPRISPVGIYSNIPQANVSPIHPPAINRGLKPRKVSDGGTLSSCEMSPPPSGGGPQDVLGVAVGSSPAPPASAPPAVDRNLKPAKNHYDQAPIKSIVLDPAPLRYKKHDQRIRAAPSPTPPTLGNGRCNNESGDEPERTSNPNSRRNSTQDEQIFHPLPSRSQHEIQYTDLDLDLDARHSPKPLKPVLMKNSTIASSPSVVYKTIDFVKTEVFNEMKKNVEDTYRKNQ